MLAIDVMHREAELLEIEDQLAEIKRLFSKVQTWMEDVARKRKPEGTFPPRVFWVVDPGVSEGVTEAFQEFRGQNSLHFWEVVNIPEHKVGGVGEDEEEYYTLRVLGKTGKI